ncbi:prepilin peptidase [Vibrio bivalvicida]|uniref:Prepilin type IV endopeptidase peptidase domain-containing protein n=1 Tax=Vibrio bivalvicida TaxID=1276888 RepID=A0A177XVC1_9VIBR|nr:A24 family peptidase [Vibrio bivalvicida]OAJ92469.1 hypothetical protein APB76_19240 [Vibrio bivalvicida]
MSYLIWLGFIVVAVTDARENRIPNLYLLLILAICIVDKGLSAAPVENLLWSAVAGLSFFVSALLLHFIRVMAPGDVKLLGVVGFWLGWGNLIDATVWIALSSVVVGVLYAVMNRAESGSSIKQLVSKYSMIAAYGSSSHAALSAGEKIERKLRMPFAPVVVIGLAMYQYF